MTNCALCGTETILLVQGPYSSICTNCVQEIADGKRCSLCGVTDTDRTIIPIRRGQSVNALCYNCQRKLTRTQAQIQHLFNPPQKQNEGCFIATAAYGSDLNPKLNILRDFRDHSLTPNRLGKAVVCLYYNISPPFAKILAKTETGRAMIRFVLSIVIRKLQNREILK